MAAVPRVLIGGMGAITRLGLREYFEDGGVDVVAEEVDTGQVLERMVEALPDVVVLDLDAVESAEIARSLALQFPSVKVIACSGLQPAMRVFPPFHRGESYDVPLDAASLIDAVTTKG